MKNNKQQVNRIKKEISSNLAELNLVLRKCLTHKNELQKNKLPTAAIDTVIAEGLRLLPLKNIRQVFVTPFLSLHRDYSHVAQQLDLIDFKNVLYKNSGITIAPGSNNKVYDIEFANQLGINVPKIYQKNKNINDIIFDTFPIVLKPTTGASSEGVYYIYSETNIIEVKNSQPVENLDTLVQFLSQKYKSLKKWNIEQLIHNKDNKPANDFKVYAYYGEIGCVLQVDRLSGISQRCWYDKESKLLETERLAQEATGQTWLEGKGFSKSLLDSAKKISLETPVPFLRIDFLEGKDGVYYLGEITPHPGRYFPEYSRNMDHYLGSEFQKANARLFADLLHKKSFDTYFTVYKDYLPSTN